MLGDNVSRRTDTVLEFWDAAVTRIDTMSFPRAVLDSPAGVPVNRTPEIPVDERLAGFLAIGACLAGMTFIARWRRAAPAISALALCGFCWTAITPFTVGHPFEAIFLVGVLLIGWSAAFFGLRRLAGSRAIVVAAAVAAALFGVSSLEMSRAAAPSRHAETPRGFAATRTVGHDAEAVRFLRDLPDDFDVIREKIPKDSIVWIAAPSASAADLRTEMFGARFAVDFYLSGYILSEGPATRDAADFVLTNERVDGPALLTPENREVFLYDGALYDGWRRDKP